MIRLMLLAALLSVLLVAQRSCVTPRVSCTSQPSRRTRPRVLSVSELRANPLRLKGEIKVVGRVASVNRARKLFGLMDAAQQCGPSPCGQSQSCLLPVSWDRDLPEAGRTVLVSGSITDSRSGLVLKATEVTTQ